MSKGSARGMKDDLRPAYDLSKLKGGVLGKYYERAKSGTNLVLVDPDLAKAFPDADSVNRALRALLEAVNATTGSSKRPCRGNVSLDGAIRKRAGLDVLCKARNQRGRREIKEVRPFDLCVAGPVAACLRETLHDSRFTGVENKR